MLIQGINVGTKVATKLGPKVISKLKTMDKSKVSSIVNKAKDLSGKAITEFKRSFLSLPKTTVRAKEKFVPGTVQRRGLRRTDKGKLKTQTEGQEGEIARTKKTKQTITAMDNFDSVGTARLEEFNKKMSFILGAAYTDQSLLGTLEPVYDILSGNTTAITRWSTQMTNSLYPLGSLFLGNLNTFPITKPDIPSIFALNFKGIIADLGCAGFGFGCPK